MSAFLQNLPRPRALGALIPPSASDLTVLPGRAALKWSHWNSASFRFTQPFGHFRAGCGFSMVLCEGRFPSHRAVPPAEMQLLAENRGHRQLWPTDWARIISVTQQLLPGAVTPTLLLLSARGDAPATKGWICPSSPKIPLHQVTAVQVGKDPQGLCSSLPWGRDSPAHPRAAGAVSNPNPTDLPLLGTPKGNFS